MERNKGRNTLFRKLMITYSIPIVVSFIILSVLLINLFDRYFVENKKELLIEQSQKIANDMAEAYFLGRLDTAELNEDIRILDKFLNARIWLSDDNGNIQLVSTEQDRGNLAQKVNKDIMSTLFRGYYIVERGNFSGMLKEHALTVGYPIFLGESFKGAVFIHASQSELKKTLKDIYGITIGAILLAVFLVYLGLYIQIKRISYPLREIRDAARKVASGEFNKRLNIKTNDEIEELGKSFNYMADSLEKIEENRKNLVANISHDLRTPMTSIVGFVEGILDGTIPEEQQTKYLEVILDESKRLVRITNDLLELSNIQQGVIKVNKIDFELNEILRRKLLSFERKITDKKLDVSLTLEDEKCWVHSDIAYIERIIQNLLDNAVKFTPENGRVHINVSLSASEALLEISNTGTAINSEELNKIWDRFHKGDASRGQYKGGFGLGLAIVREMINQLDERITVESQNDLTTFSFTIKKSKDK